MIMSRLECYSAAAERTLCITVAVHWPVVLYFIIRHSELIADHGAESSCTFTIAPHSLFPRNKVAIENYRLY